MSSKSKDKTANALLAGYSGIQTDSVGLLSSAALCFPAAGEGVYKIVLPRAEATTVLDYQTLSPNLGLNSWAAFASGVHHEAILTGQFLVLDDEVNPVLGAVLDAGLDITGLAAASYVEGRHSGIRSAIELARAIRYALNVQVGAVSTRSGEKI